MSNLFSKRASELAKRVEESPTKVPTMLNITNNVT